MKRTARRNKPPPSLRILALSILGLLLLCAICYGLLTLASKTGRESIIVNGMEREYRVHLPKGFDPAKPFPLVLAFHMLGGNSRQMEWLSHMNKVADEHGFIVVYPDGYKNSWADGSGLFAADQEKIDDVAFTSELIDEMTDLYNIDGKRVYATGFSNGGFLTHRLACEIPDRLAAVATVGATLPKDVLPECEPVESISVMMINGTDDYSVKWDGSEDFASVTETTSKWALLEECSKDAQITDEPDVVDDDTEVNIESYQECLDNVEVRLYIIKGGGHTWPQGNQLVQLGGLFTGKISQEIDTSQEIWAFFADHPKP